MPMTTFDFTVVSGGFVCTDSTDKKHPIYKKENDKWVLMYADEKPVRVGNGNTCQKIEASGDYQIRFSDGTCSGKDAPVFSYNEVQAPLTPVSIDPRVISSRQVLNIGAGEQKTLSPPADANYAEITVWAENSSAYISWTLAGDTPNLNGNGHRTSDGKVIELESRTEIDNLKVTANKDLTLYITYFKLTPAHVE